MTTTEKRAALPRCDFRLSERELGDVAELFVERFRQGLLHEGEELKCLPMFVPTPEPGASPPLSGGAYVLDLGGSNLRASYVELDPLHVHPPLTTTMPWQRGKPFEKNQYLQMQAGLLDRLPQTQSAALGYCFSYPAVGDESGDARLVRWTKGVNVPGVEGTRVGQELVQYLEEHYQRRLSPVAVVNDTVTSLLAGLTLPPVDACVGLIAGTGTNLAALLHAEQIPKLRSASFVGSGVRLPLNLESGNFCPPHLSEWDAALDMDSENPGAQRFEKAVSGLYLGRLFALANPDLRFDADAGAQGLVSYVEETADLEVRRAGLSVYQRSAQLVAAQLAGLALFYRDSQSCQSLRIIAEGGLAWSTACGHAYHDLVMAALKALLKQHSLENLSVEIARVPNANLIGAATAARLLQRYN